MGVLLAAKSVDLVGVSENVLPAKVLGKTDTSAPVSIRYRTPDLGSDTKRRCCLASSRAASIPDGAVSFPVAQNCMVCSTFELLLQISHDNNTIPPPFRFHVLGFLRQSGSGLVGHTCFGYGCALCR